MSMVTEFVTLVMQVDEEMRQQSAQMRGYLDAVDRLMSQVASVMEGSSRAEERDVTEQLDRTRHQVEETIAQLASAHSMLERLRSI